MNAERWVQRLENCVEVIVKWIVVTILAILCVNVFVQVILRYIFLYSSRWTLEVSRYLIIWAVLLASGPALKYGVLVGVDTLTQRLQPRTRTWISCVLRVLMGIFACTIVFQALKLMQSQWEMNQLSPALEIPMPLVYMAMPVGFSVFLFYLIVLTSHDLLHPGRSTTTVIKIE
jgi:TRAP-type C4-dicarboxylate transport system permease small subunit